MSGRAAAHDHVRDHDHVNALALVLVLVVGLVPTTAHADLNGRLSVTGVVVSESQDPAPAAADPRASTDASPVLLGYGDLRASLQGRRMGGGVELGADFRVRITSDLTAEDTVSGNLPATSRGYAGGREYNLREAWIGRRGDNVDFAVGRMFIRESDALHVDGLRLSYRATPAWTASIFGGLFPNPYSRSLLTDYQSSSDGSALAGAIGGSVAYSYPRIWGSASVAGLVLGGNSDGSPFDPRAATEMMLAAPQGEASRVYLTWTNYLRVASWLDLFHDVVVDAAGPAGAQLTRADVLLHLHVRRFTLAAGYDHLSTIAVEMYLARLLADRTQYATLTPGTVENNLVVQRTARDEGHLRAEVNPFGRLRIYGDARLRRRALVERSADPAFAGVEPQAAWDVTVGARSAGDLAGLRIGAWFSEITDFRSETRLAGVELGRDFLSERLTIDASFLWEGVRDAGAGASACMPTRDMNGMLDYALAAGHPLLRAPERHHLPGRRHRAGPPHQPLAAPRRLPSGLQLPLPLARRPDDPPAPHHHPPRLPARRSPLVTSDDHVVVDRDR